VGLFDGTAQSAFNNLGFIFSGSASPQFRDLQKAESYYLRAIFGAPMETVRARYNLALIYVEQGRGSDARVLLQELDEQLTNAADRRHELLKPSIKSLLQRVLP
jgi:cytochrome c-type biogenesis protein CcmH/NrfG